MPKLFTKATGAALLAVVAVGGLVTLALEAPLSAATAQSNQAVTLSLRYSCTSSSGGVSSAAVVLTGVVPTTVVPGEMFSVGSVQGTATFPPSVAAPLVQSGKRTVAATLTKFDFKVANASPSVENLAPITVDATLRPGQPLTFTAPGLPESLGPFTAGTHGVATITPVSLVLQLPDATLSCSNPQSLSGHLPVYWQVPIGSPTVVPLGTFGGVGVAVLAGGGFIWHQRRKRKVVAMMASAD